ncbi:MAG: hypothetical protein QOD42_1475 [Sphingomonadales bacterium]|jgi:hypothetical protein|nr:hypothetical protein [Sphingomonadales bacterium]
MRPPRGIGRPPQAGHGRGLRQVRKGVTMTAGLLRAAFIGCALLICAMLAPRAHAETPVDRCTDAGSAASAPSAMGTGFQPEPNHMHRVMFLENPSVDVDGPNGELRVFINRADLIVEEMASGHRRFINDIADLVDPAGEIDIQLKLAYFDGRLVLYWRETFQNRHYRQGLFNILGTNVSPSCSGLGGSDVVR